RRAPPPDRPRGAPRPAHRRHRLTGAAGRPPKGGAAAPGRARSSPRAVACPDPVRPRTSPSAGHGRPSTGSPSSGPCLACRARLCGRSAHGVEKEDSRMASGSYTVAILGPLLDGDDTPERERLAAAGARVVAGRGGSEEEIIASCAGADVVMAFGG